MFTGIIRHVADVIDRRQENGVIFLTFSPYPAADVQPGDSLAVNGACLTVVHINEEGWSARLMAETIKRTNLGSLHPGDRVNLERPLTAGQAIDGHFVMGHVDDTCLVTDISASGEDKIFTFAVAPRLLPYLIPKGSVTLDGVALTVVEITGTSYTVSMMPYTLEHTTFGTVQPGYQANIEVDVLGKYVISLLQKDLGQHLVSAADGRSVSAS